MRRNRGREFQDDFYFIVRWFAELIDDYEDRKAHRGTLNIGITLRNRKGRVDMSQVLPASGSDVESIPLSISPKDAAGIPVTGGNYVWASSDPNVVGLAPSADGLSCMALFVGVGMA